MARIIIDPESKSLSERCALIKTHNKRRARFPAGCVTLVDDEDKARACADEDQSLYPAVVYGPSASSEGQQIYYLVRWL